MNNINEDKKLILSISDFKNYFLEHEYNENMFTKDNHLNPKYNSFKNTGIIPTIFEDNWNNFYNTNKDLVDKYRPNAPTEVSKIIDCMNKDLGCTVYKCPDCNDYIFVGNTCKSRLCTSCGYKYKLERVENILSTAYNCNHRQIVFTIPKEFRKFLFFPFDRIDILFDAVNLTLNSILNTSYKKTNKKKRKKKYISKQKYYPGFFAFLHTFGRDLKWNPHIHVLIAEMKISDIDIKKWDYFDFNALSKRFQKIITDLMLKHFSDFSKEDARKAYLNHPNGFYVYAEKKEFKSLKEGIEYVTRYCGRCPISENRIIKYENNNVTFCYNAHEDDSYHEVTVSAFEFIKMILRHIIPNNYKIIRYFGFYRKKPKLHNSINKLISEEKRNIRKKFLSYSMSIQKFFKRHPLYCPHCDVKMDCVAFVT